ncbi:hypothetical protein OF001_U290008 [Pseudomonas sp. OF001]|nr:hypothetical protein OF001_U290008 [Pseudomonas sp. OF001]
MARLTAARRLTGAAAGRRSAVLPLPRHHSRGFPRRSRSSTTPTP